MKTIDCRNEVYSSRDDLHNLFERLVENGDLGRADKEVEVMLGARGYLSLIDKFKSLLDDDGISFTVGDYSMRFVCGGKDKAKGRGKPERPDLERDDEE